MSFKNTLNCSGNSSKVSIPFKLKRFVSASSQSQITCTQGSSSSFHDKKNGDIISNYYLNVCRNRENNNRSSSSDDDEDVMICEVLQKKRKAKAAHQIEINSDQQITINHAMRYAQYDDVESLKHLIEKGLSVNTTDIFGWSLLMVASFAGSKSVVKYLVSKGARKGKRDGKGNTALYLASKNNHMDIVNLLIKKKETLNFEIDPVNEEIEIVEKLDTEARLCEVCNMTPTCSAKEHETSIAHLFQLGSSISRTMFGIPRNNVGFQMLLQQGWNEIDGLGPEGTGRKYPIKANEKQDKLGFGHNSSGEAPRTMKENTHKFISRKNSKLLEKQKEKHFRRLLNEPDF